MEYSYVVYCSMSQCLIACCVNNVLAGREHPYHSKINTRRKPEIVASNPNSFKLLDGLSYGKEIPYSQHLAHHML